MLRILPNLPDLPIGPSVIIPQKEHRLQLLGTLQELRVRRESCSLHFAMISNLGIDA